MIEFSSLKLKEIHRVNSPFNEDPKNLTFFQGVSNFGGGTAGKFRENGKTSIVMQIREWSISKKNISPTPWYQNPCDASIFLHARPNFREKI